MNALEIVESCRSEMRKRIVGQDALVDGILTSLAAGGHVLLEGVPGLAKTLAVKTLAGITTLSFKRIQFTPDILPADLTGTTVFSPDTREFSVRKGPIFANIVLADEVNRAPGKVQSALLEAMEEKQVTLGNETLPLPAPFFVLATQNPIEHDGTYPLPEAELDRFLIKIKVTYPANEDEVKIIAEDYTSAPVSTVLDASSLEHLQKEAAAVFVDAKIDNYIVSIVRATRSVKKEGKRPDGLYRYISFGASVRGGAAVRKCAKARALFAGRDYVTPDDVKKAAIPALRHRIILSYEAEAENIDADNILERILMHIETP